jgi:hypothetical protein
MSSISNLNEISTNPGRDTDLYFTNLIEQAVDIGLADNDSITAFFEKRTGSKIAAKGLAGAFIISCRTRDIDVMSALDTLKNTDASKLDVYSATILNLTRAGTSMLGVINRPAVSPYTTRSIVA